MAWVYDESFDSYGDGDLANHADWVDGYSNGNIVVGDYGADGSPYDGTKALRINISDNPGTSYVNASIDDTTGTSGTYYFAFGMDNKSVLESGGGNFNVQVSDQGTKSLIVNFYYDDIKITGSDGAKTLVSAYSNDVWYIFKIEYDFTAHTYAAYYKEDGDSSWSGNVTGSIDSTATVFDHLRINGGTASGSTYAWFDIITPTDPTPAGTSFTSKIMFY